MKHQMTILKFDLSSFVYPNKTSMKKAIGVLLLLVAFKTSHAQVTCLPGSLSTGIMAFYPFSSGSINDYSGGAHHLVNPTTAAPSTDRFGNGNCAYHFDKTAGDYLHVPMPGANFVNGITAAPFSISLWFQNTAPTAAISAFQVMIGRGVPGSSGRCPDTWEQWSIALYDCRQPVAGFDRRSLWSGWSGASTCAGIVAHFTGSWHHLALTYTGSVRNLYVDGVLYSAVGDTCGPVTMDLGDLVLGEQYTGDLDDIIIYNHALTASEVSALNGAVACCGTTTPTAISTIEETKPHKALKVFPNPSNNNISVSSRGSIIRNVGVYTATGAEYGVYNFDSREVSIDISAMASGMYFIKVTTDSETTVEKLIKQ
jgi:hypothetical protein